MSNLSNFSIETDKVVLLTFSDGKKVRASLAEAGKLLSAEDMDRIVEALRRRHKFVKHILPPWARAVTIAVLLFTVGIGSVKAFTYVTKIGKKRVAAPVNAPAPAVAAKAIAGNDQSTLGAETGPSVSPSPQSRSNTNSPAKANDKHEPAETPHPAAQQHAGLVDEVTKPVVKTVKKVVDLLPI